MNPEKLQEIKKAESMPVYTDVNQVPLSLLEQLSGHWKAIVEQKRRQHDVNTRQIILGQIFTIVAVGAFSVFVEQNKEALLLVGSTLILYPSLVDLLVSNSAVLAASVHHDVDAQTKNHFLYVAGATIRSVTVAVLACGVIGLVAGGLGWAIFGASFLQTLQLSVLAGFLAGIIGMPLIVSITFIARRLRANPDDVIPPVENTVFNVLVLFVIGIASRILT